MKGALIILLFTVVVGFILYLFDLRHKKKLEMSEDNPSASEAASETLEMEEKSDDASAGECCGLHLVCEKELDAIANDKILYYDDEELDRFAGRGPLEYQEEEIEEFREVLFTLLPQDLPGWARSLDRRRIQPPQEIRDSLLIMIGELAK